MSHHHHPGNQPQGGGAAVASHKEQYCILKGTVVAAKPFSQRDANRPHYHLHIQADGKDYDVAINIRSEISRDAQGNPVPVNVLYAIKDASNLPILNNVKNFPEGVKNLDGTEGLSLDYVSQNLVSEAEMRDLPIFDPTVDQTDDIMDAVKKGMADGATFIAFGHRYKPASGFDPAWDFRPDDGVHNIHMNQGNQQKFANETARNEDGALLINSGDNWTIIYVAFHTQSWNNALMVSPSKLTVRLLSQVGGVAPPI